MPGAPVPDAASIGRPTAAARQRDPWLLCLAASLWLSMAWLQPLSGFAALAGLCLSLLLCKSLAMAPSWRAFVAPMPTFAALPFLAAGRAAVMGALLGAVGYLAFTLLRRALYRLRAWLDTYRFRTPDGQADGWDYGRWLLACERLRAKLRPLPRRRILFPPTDMEAALREGMRHGGDRLHFAEPTPENLREHDLVVPLTLPDLARMRAFEPLLVRNPLPLPDADCVALCDDKLACNRALAAAGFADFVPSIADALPFPYVLKKRIDAWGDNTHVVADSEDEDRLAALSRDPNYFRQAFVPGQREYAAHLLVRDGRIVAALAVEYVFAHDLHKKCREHPPRYQRLRRARHLPLLRRMLAAIGYEGLCCVNYKLEDGRVRILEINPRFGASLAPWFFVMARALPRAPRGIKASATTSGASPTAG